MGEVYCGVVRCVVGWCGVVRCKAVYSEDCWMVFGVLGEVVPV